jgi:hypothetical protein
VEVVEPCEVFDSFEDLRPNEKAANLPAPPSAAAPPSNLVAIGSKNDI